MNYRALILASLTLAASSAACAQTAGRPAGSPRAQPPAAAPPRATPAAAAPAAAAKPTDASIEARANALTVNMQQNLALNPAQTEKVRAINQRSVERVETIRLRYRATPGKMRGMVEDVSAGRLAALKDVLAPAQFDKYQRKREEKMGLPNTQGAQGNVPPGLSGGE